MHLEGTLRHPKQALQAAQDRDDLAYDADVVAADGEEGRVGRQDLHMILLLSSVVGAIIGLALLARRGQDSHTPLPFGPYLAAAGWIALLWGEGINGAYLQWSGLG